MDATFSSFEPGRQPDLSPYYFTIIVSYILESTHGTIDVVFHKCKYPSNSNVSILSKIYVGMGGRFRWTDSPVRFYILVLGLGVVQVH